MARVVGRERELAVAREFLERASRRSAVLVLEGEAGIGKTTVWREAIRLAAEEGVRVLECRPGELETKLAFSAVTDLLDAIPDERFGSLPEPQSRALEVALLRAEPGPSPSSPDSSRPRSVPCSKRWRRRDACSWPSMTSSGLTLGSAMVIEFAQRRLSSRVGWLFTHRVGEPARLAGGSTSTTVGPLTVAGLHQVLDDRLDHAFTRPALSRIHAASAGNPLFAIEIARELVRTGDIVGAAPMPVPENLRRLIARRVHQLPPATRDALLACAALAQPTTSLVDEQVLAPAEEDGIVTVDDEGRIVFAHPLYASAVYGSAPRRRRRELHAELAELVDDVEERARHLAQAVDEPDERSAHALEGAAGVARSRGAWESAGELLEHAADLTPPVDRAELHRRVIGAAEHHAHAGDRARARSSLSEPSARRSLAH